MGRLRQVVFYEHNVYFGVTEVLIIRDKHKNYGGSLYKILLVMIVRKGDRKTVKTNINGMGRWRQDAHLFLNKQISTQKNLKDSPGHDCNNGSKKNSRDKYQRHRKVEAGCS